MQLTEDGRREKCLILAIIKGNDLQSLLLAVAFKCVNLLVQFYILTHFLIDV